MVNDRNYFLVEEDVKFMLNAVVNAVSVRIIHFSFWGCCKTELRSQVQASLWLKRKY